MFEEHGPNPNREAEFARLFSFNPHCEHPGDGAGPSQSGDWSSQPNDSNDSDDSDGAGSSDDSDDSAGPSQPKRKRRE
jgi:hypothetical protein